MQTPLLLTTFVMGLAGGPHCIAMCGAACAGFARSGSRYGLWQFLLGRLLGYAALGAVAAGSVSLLAWFSSQTAALHPLWTFFHVLVLSWGLILVAYARQPLWVDQLGKALWYRVQAIAKLSGGIFFTGTLWAFVPCGLLYSAVLVSALADGPLNGAISMAGFAVGSSIALFFGPWLWLRLRTNKRHEVFSMRIAGLLLCMAALFAIWMDLTHLAQPFCVTN